MNPNGFGSVTSQRALNDHDIGTHVSGPGHPASRRGQCGANDAAEFGAASDFTRTTIVDTGTRPGDHAFAIGPLVGYDPLTRPGTHETVDRPPGMTEEFFEDSPPEPDDPLRADLIAMIRDRDYATPRHRQRALGPRIPRSCIHSPKDRRHSPACRGACYATAGVVPYTHPNRSRTADVP